MNTVTVKYRPFGKTNLSFFPLGLGTIWFGRQWPPENMSYQLPSSQEVSGHLHLAYKVMGNQNGIVMIDTAAAYGDGEVRIGDFLRKNPKYAAKSFVATKWGETFDVKSGVSIVDHSINNLKRSFDSSLSRLGKVDLFYLHKTNPDVLKDTQIIQEMEKIKDSALVSWLGASISDSLTLREATEKNLLIPFDVIQMPASVFLEEKTAVKCLHETGKAIVLNSPVRKSNGKDPSKNYAELLAKPEVSVILTGTRAHLAETISYMKHG